MPTMNVGSIRIDFSFPLRRSSCSPNAVHETGSSTEVEADLADDARSASSAVTTNISTFLLGSSDPQLAVLGEA